MAKRDVIKYYYDCQAQYLEMLSDTKDFDEALKGGFISQEQFDQAQTLLNVVKNNYERLSYVILLLNEPNKKEKKAKFKKQNKDIYESLKGSSKEAIAIENEDALKKFKELVRESKNGN